VQLRAGLQPWFEGVAKLYAEFRPWRRVFQGG
jgi:hypothetical protein